MIIFPNIDPKIYFKWMKYFFVKGNRKEAKKDGKYNFTEITESSQRNFRNVY